jgi:hypothetical protein
VSQIWSLIFSWLTSTIFSRKSIPIVAMYDVWKSSNANLLVRDVFPAPASPRILIRKSLIRFLFLFCLTYQDLKFLIVWLGVAVHDQVTSKQISEIQCQFQDFIHFYDLIFLSHILMKIRHGNSR